MVFLVRWHPFSKVYRFKSQRYFLLTLRCCLAIVKMFYARRNPDQTQKKQIMESSSVIAEIMLKHIAQDSLGVYSDVCSVDIA